METAIPVAASIVAGLACPAMMWRQRRLETPGGRELAGLGRRPVHA